ncbi:MAG TPA: 3-hydroxy-3-methylglutaryl CoA synthase [Dehalococcoidia bacterium]|nr:3-hydroxy-3-methylglutaryl CoA synthase [Dehalococcoidia bacterium]
MAGIKSYGAYIPYYRMPRSVISAAWGRGGGRGELAIAGYDEDAVSMSVSAGIDCLKGTDPQAVDAVYLATTTPPYLERLGSNIVSNALDFRRDVRNADFGNSLRAGVSALMAAVDAVNAGSLGNILVTASDLRMGTPGGEHEQALGDGAAAFLVGNDAVAVEIEGSVTYSDDLADYWRMDGDEFIRSWEDRFGRDAGYSQIPAEVVKKLMEKLNLTPQDISKACIAGANARAQGGLARRMGFAPEQVQDPLLDNVGNTGVAQPLMMLISALEDAKPGERFLMVSWGTGCDAVVLKITDQIEKIKDRRAIKRHLAIKGTLDNYGKYMRWRDIVPTQVRARGGISMSAEWRERKLGLALYGVKCRNCGTVQLYMRGSSMRAHVCLECQAKDNFEPYRFSDKTGKVVTFSHDFLGGGINPPMTRAVVNFEGGGRGLFDLVDRDPEECKVGMDVEMTFRMTRTADNAKSYFWKIKPVRE